MNSLETKFNALTDVSLEGHLVRSLKVFKDKVEFGPERHQSPQIRSHRSVRKKTKQEKQTVTKINTC